MDKESLLDLKKIENIAALISLVLLFLGLGQMHLQALSVPDPYRTEAWLVYGAVAVVVIALIILIFIRTLRRE